MVCDGFTEEQAMSKKKTKKAGKKAPAAPLPKVEEADTTTVVTENQSVESDLPAVARRSIEAGNENASSDVERPDE
jgi:hypothetical protein